MTMTARPATEPEVPRATRYAVAGWRDPRLLVGLLIVTLSVVAGSLLLSRADDTTVLWGVRADLPVGAVLTAADLEQRHVHLGDGEQSRYLRASGDDPVGRRLARAVGGGELLPAGALAARGDLAGVRVPITVADADLPGPVEVGSLVDVWVVPDSAGGGSGDAARVLAGVRVVAVAGTEDSLAPQTKRSVVVLVPGTVDEAVLGPVIGRTTAGRVLLTQAQIGASQ